jgi:hypothetical protein
MAQTKRKRRSKHRGTAAGSIEARGRTSRPPSGDQKKKLDRNQARQARLDQKPTWNSSLKRAALAAAFMFAFLILIGKGKNRVISAVVFGLFALLIYIPAGYYLEMWMWNRRQRRKAEGR